MAFNPFHGFRKHQKVFMAGLTIACMFIFVFTGSAMSGWEFFMGLGQAFGFTRPPTEQVATLYAKPIHYADLNQVRMQREMANQFVTGAIFYSSEYATNRANDLLKTAKFTPNVADQIKQILSDASTMRRFLADPQLAQFRENLLREAPQRYQRHDQTLQSILAGIGDPQKMPDVDIARSVWNVIQQDRMLLNRSSTLFFGGSLDSKSLLDFMIWRHKADELGIQFSTAEVGGLVNQMRRAGWSNQDDARLQADLRRKYTNFTPEMLIAAIGDEFRVQLAQEAFLGTQADQYPQPNSPLPPALTPYELWKYFQDQRGENSVVLLPIPVHHADFINKAGTPTDAELKDLYEKNKDRMYHPGSDLPSFKQPVRMGLEWVSASPDSIEFKRAADVALAATQASQIFDLGGAVGNPFGNVATTVFQLSQPVKYTAALLDEHSKTRYRFRSPIWLNYEYLLHDSSVNQPGTVANSVAQGLAGLGTGAPAIVETSAGYLGYATRQELRGRVQAAATLVLSGSDAAMLAPVSGSGLLADVAQPLIPLTVARATLPESAYMSLRQTKPYVEEKLTTDMARHLVRTAMTNLSSEWQKRAHPGFTSAQVSTPKTVPTDGASIIGHAANMSPFALAATLVPPAREQAIANARAAAAIVFGATSGPAPIATAALVYRDQTLPFRESIRKINDAVARLGLKRGATSRMRDQFDLGEDSGITPLKTALNRSQMFGESSNKTDRQFAKDLFDRVQYTDIYTPTTAGDPFGGEQFLYWKNGERGAYVPTFDEIKDKVQARWLADKARPLAEEEAKRVAEKIRSLKTTGEDAARALRDESKVAGTPVELERVAPLIETRAMQPNRMGSGQYQFYDVPEQQVEFPSNEMKDALFKLRTPGEVVVVHDQPRDHYYVGVLKYRPMMFPMSFFEDAAQPNKRSWLVQKFELDTKQRAKQLESILEQLRSQAGLHIDEEKLKDTGPIDDA